MPPVEALYIYAMSERIAMLLGGLLNYLLSDRLGSMIATVDRSGTMTSGNSYHPRGTAHQNSSTSPTDYGYTGQKKEGDVCFYNAKWYDPQLGRFMQEDTIVPSPQGTQGFDRFAYANNNPMKYTDPSRMWLYDQKEPGCHENEEESIDYKLNYSRTFNAPLIYSVRGSFDLVLINFNMSIDVTKIY